MTNEQYDRWLDFALRMAKTCFLNLRRPDSKWIVEKVEQFFDEIDYVDIPCIVDWDRSNKYPVGNPRYCRRLRTKCWDCRGIGCDKPYCENGSVYDYAGPYCAGDMVSEFLSNYVPRFVCGKCRCECRWSDKDNCPKCSKECCCDDTDQLGYYQWSDQWGGPVRCCVRAGLDMASSPSTGVVGFTAGDIRRMYPEGVPSWVFHPDEHLYYWLTDKRNGTFADLPDTTGVVL